MKFSGASSLVKCLGFEEDDKMIRFDIPSEEARLLRETAERFIVDRYTLEQRRKILVDQSLMAKNWLAMA